MLAFVCSILELEPFILYAILQHYIVWTFFSACYLQHLGAGTFHFASHVHFACYLQHFIVGTCLSACYLQHLGAGNFHFASHLHFACYLQHYIVWTFLSACYLQHLGAATFHFASYVQHLGAGTFHFASYVQHLGAGTFHFAWCLHLFATFWSWNLPCGMLFTSCCWLLMVVSYIVVGSCLFCYSCCSCSRCSCCSFCSCRRKFRSQTSDNMDRWKAEQGRGREKRKTRRKKSRRERVRRKKMQMREKVGKSRNTVFFQWFGALEERKVGSLKRRVRSQLARWEMNNCTPLWREAHFQVKMLKALGVRTTFGGSDVEKVHAVVARSMSKCQKH